MVRHKRDPVHVFQPPLVKLFTGSSACPVRGPTGNKPVVYRIERWVLETSIRPLESRAVFRVVAAIDTHRYAVDDGACAHPSGCSLASKQALPSGSNRIETDALERRRPGPSTRNGPRSPLSNFSFADDVIFPNEDGNAGPNDLDGSDDGGAPA